MCFSDVSQTIISNVLYTIKDQHQLSAPAHLNDWQLSDFFFFFLIFQAKPQFLPLFAITIIIIIFKKNEEYILNEPQKHWTHSYVLFWQSLTSTANIQTILIYEFISCLFSKNKKKERKKKEKKNDVWMCWYKSITEGEKSEKNTCIIQLYLIWDQFLSPLLLLVSRRRNGTCQNKGSEIRLEQSWAGHLGGRLSISHSACCLLHSHSCTHTSPLTNCVIESTCVSQCVSCVSCVCVCVWST